MERTRAPPTASDVREIDHYNSGGLIVWADITLDGRTHFERGTGTSVRYRDEVLEPYVCLFADINIMATPGSSFTPTPLGHEDNLEVRQHPRPNALHSFVSSECQITRVVENESRRDVTKQFCSK
ncbi:hypothetical protein TNCV_3787191 [Trichonephila clavipes]|nr:hypothetical protein TNCV_3787191 [Trichonephila clavipes]